MTEKTQERISVHGTPSSGLFWATFGFFMGFAAVSLYGPVAKHFKQTLGLSGLALGLLVAAPQLTGSLLRIPFGAWVDKVGGKKPFMVLFLLSLAGMAGLWLLLRLYQDQPAPPLLYPGILLCGFLSGCGVATFSVGIPQTAYWFPKSRQGAALGAYAGLGNTAPGIFVIILPLALAAFGLVGAYGLWFLFLLVGTVLYWVFAVDAPYFQFRSKGKSHEEAQVLAKEAGQELIPSGQLIQALKRSARIGRTWALVALYFTSFGGFLALTTWFPAYWSLFHNLEIRQAGLLTAVGFSLLASIIRVFGGGWSDKFGGEKTAIVSFLVTALGAVILIFGRDFWPCLLGGILMGAGMGVANAAVFKLVPQYVPEAVGGASGWIGGLGAFGGFVVPPCLGVFVDSFGREGYAQGFWIYVILALFSIGISFALQCTKKKEEKRR